MNLSRGFRSDCSFCRIPRHCPFALPEIRSEARRALEWRYYNKESAVFRLDEEALGVFVIQSGWVALFARGTEGKRVAIGLRGPGSILGLSETIESSAYLATAETGEETELEFLPAAQLLILLERSAAFRTQVLKSVAGHTRQIMNELLDVGRVPAEQRLWRILRELAQSSACRIRETSDLRLSISIKHLSEQIGCSRQWTSGLLASLEQSGALRRENGWIILPEDVAAACAREKPTRGNGHR